MSIDKYVEKMKDVQNHLQKFIECDDNEEENFQILTKLFDDLKINSNYHEFKTILYLLNEISNNHFRNSKFIHKIEQIIHHLQESIKQNFSNLEIFKIFKKNKRILLFLIKNNILNIDDNIFTKMKKQYNSETCNHLLYFYPEIKNFLTKELIDKYSNQIDENFEEKRLKGENDSYICELIRNDSIKEFVTYVNKTNTSITGCINESFYETNRLLVKNGETTLIEYAAFFGSIQIFQYLRLNNIQLYPNLWTFVIHGRNPELIHLLEGDKIEAPNNNDFKKCLRESIRCHHNEIKEYIQNNYIIDEKEKSFDFYSNVFDFYDFSLIQSDFVNQSSFYFLCKNDFYVLVDLLLKSNSIDVNYLYDLKVI